MAGSYTDSPSRRFAWDADGTVALLTADMGGETATLGTAPNNPYAAMTTGEREGLNSGEYAVQVSTDTQDHRRMALVFPEPREIDGIYVSCINRNPGSNFKVGYSLSTTNGIDGSWTDLSVTADYDPASDAWRDDFTSKAVASVEGLQLVLGGNTFADVNYMHCHLYGTISPGETPDRIVFLDTEAADAVFTKPIDYGDTPRGQTQTRTIKVKNNSAGSTIETVQVTAEDVYLDAGGFYTFSDDGVSYQATLPLGDLGPGAEETVYVKQSIPDDATVGLQTGLIRVSHSALS